MEYLFHICIQPNSSNYMNIHILIKIYTVVHKKGATFIFSITLANIDGFS